MGTDSNIDWTTHTWNPWQGCHRTTSPGCANCYMHAEKKRYGQNPNVVVRSKPPTFNAPLEKWHDPARVFACSWSDFFIEEADPWRDEAWDVIRRTRHLMYQILTKRTHRIHQCLPADWGDGWEHVMLGASASTQPDLERVMRDLPHVPAAVRFLSLEPLLERVDLGDSLGLTWERCDSCGGQYPDIYWADDEQWKKVVGDTFAGLRCPACFKKQAETAGLDPKTKILKPPLKRVDWIIIGGESGPKARRYDLAWPRSVIEQCKVAGVPVFHKQLGANPGRMIGKVWHPWPGKGKNNDPATWPEDLRVREMP